MADGTAETAALLDRVIRYKGVRAVLRTRAADLAAATADRCRRCASAKAR